MMELRRPISGGTKDGLRPKRYSYWRTGYGEDNALPFAVASAGSYHCLPMFRTDSTEGWGNAHLYYLVDGEAELIVSRNKQANVQTVKAGQLLYIPKCFEFSFKASSAIQIHWLSLRGNWAIDSFFKTPSTVTLLDTGKDDLLEASFIRLREALILKEESYMLWAIGEVFQLFAKLNTRLSKELSKDTALPSVKSQYPEAVRNAIIYIKENHTEAFDAEQVAKHAHISPSHLRAQFKTYLGKSPKRFHTHYRIEQACLLLSKQQCSVSEVAFSLGYNDVNHFSKVFKQLKGVAPSRYVV